MNEYNKRNQLLKELGFKNYGVYLRSDLWSRIRREKLNRNDVCEICEFRRSTQVHHTSYTKEVLLGEILDSLLSVCGKCHLVIEFEDGIKRPLSEANNAIHNIGSMVCAKCFRSYEYHGFLDEYGDIVDTCWRCRGADYPKEWKRSRKKKKFYKNTRQKIVNKPVKAKKVRLYTRKKDIDKEQRIQKGIEQAKVHYPSMFD